jgi:hypothetical protein
MLRHITPDNCCVTLHLMSTTPWADDHAVVASKMSWSVVAGRSFGIRWRSSIWLSLLGPSRLITCNCCSYVNLCCHAIKLVKQIPPISEEWLESLSSSTFFQSGVFSSVHTHIHNISTTSAVSCARWISNLTSGYLFILCPTFVCK